MTLRQILGGMIVCELMFAAWDGGAISHTTGPERSAQWAGLVAHLITCALAVFGYWLCGFIADRKERGKAR